MTRRRGETGEGGMRVEGIGERRSRHAGPVLPRSHVRPYNTRNTCNTDNTCNTCVTHYTLARQRPAGSRRRRPVVFSRPCDSAATFQGIPGCRQMIRIDRME